DHVRALFAREVKSSRAVLVLGLVRALVLVIGLVLVLVLVIGLVLVPVLVIALVLVPRSVRHENRHERPPQARAPARCR
ncbi:MAG: hypothetical protein ACJ79M_20825, partial [Myxococcales bacterium]